ncbi:hypothetical protein EMPS_11584 [Entomortierella parvispora]|uniref:F-box domain-containing protein n=1 Tax=Entomortierella parvispora TaxID=205924 RepID=A0A9P3M2B0_9FUNG|nr:hypothetical protein EMPS_11584 [Entomortierella parvispora]
MSTESVKKSPLHIPEIRGHISRYISVTDAISCVRVSKEWYEDFIPIVWRAVDFNTQGSFEDLESKVTARLGQHLREVDNIATQGQLDALLHPNICNVRDLSLKCARTTRFRILSMDLIRNNNKSLEHLALKMIHDENADDLSTRMISLDSVIPQSSASRLFSITLYRVCISRASFTALLRGCPLLRSVDLQSNVALLAGPFVDTFQHTGVTQFTVTLEEVFKPDPDSDIAPLGFSLLAHFPELTQCTIYPSEETLIVPVERIMLETKLCCPKVRDIETWRTPLPLLSDFLAKVFRKLRSVRFPYEYLSADVILALLNHKATLSDISTIWDFEESPIERDDIPVEDDHFNSSSLALQILPRSCPNLKILRLERHEMDMDIVEEDEWACKGLRHLRVRIRGLDTKEKIDRTLKLWIDGKQTKNKPVQGETKKIDDIETRVARHLLKFDDLERVWLGTRTCHATCDQ